MSWISIVSLSILRVPANAREVLWGGQTCGNCNTSFDKWGKPVG